jgi:hypothetical protein
MHFEDLMKTLLKGVDKHLHSPIENLRTLGMIVGENLMNDLNNNYNKEDSSEKNELKFEVYIKKFFVFLI